jgi:predicted DNA-binding protein
MATKARKQIGLTMRVDLYNGLTKLAKENGQTTTHVLEQAAEHYLQFVAPTQNTVRPEVMSHVRRSIDKNRDLLKLLAK